MTGSCPVSARVCQETARERDELRRWKTEALPVLAGLQELGKALGLPLGSRIAGQEALAAVERLTREMDELSRALDNACGRVIALAHERAEVRAEVERLRRLAIWLIRLDEPDGIEERRTVTLTKIIDRARQALVGPDLHRLEDVAEEFGVDLTEGENR